MGGETEVEEGEALYNQDKIEDSTIDPDISLSYIVQNLVNMVRFYLLITGPLHGPTQEVHRKFTTVLRQDLPKSFIQRIIDKTHLLHQLAIH
ncbi:hypothetical protein ACJIZ3_016657 [Penstemon smallii]|uniref:Uncharacterized protein n=1 Tax=Penstemon smallii TaxID=265156 RepID=A0ABD3STB1_9LAMI